MSLTNRDLVLVYNKKDTSNPEVKPDPKPELDLPTESTKPGVSAPQTGDSSSVVMWLLLILASGFVLLGLNKNNLEK